MTNEFKNQKYLERDDAMAIDSFAESSVASAPELPTAIDRLQKGKAHFWLGLGAFVLFGATLYNVQKAIASVEVYKVDVLAMVNEAEADTVENSLANMTKALDEQQALLEIKKKLDSIHQSGRGMNEAEARDLLMRAGYNPDEFLSAKRKKQEEAEDLIDQDIAFAKNVARDIVREEIKDYVDKIDIMTRVGEYVVNRNK